MNNRPIDHVQWTVERILKWTTDYFTSKGIRTARLDAEVLLAHALNVDRLFLYMNFDRPLLPDEREHYRRLVARRGRREPVALITGTKEFWSIPLRVVPGVLIPRPDTEILVEAVLAEIRDIPSPTILEIGTGSGAVAVAIHREKPDSRIVATDVDVLALRTASANATDAKFVSGVAFVAMDLFSALRPRAHFDVICSNPPYVPSDTISTLEPEIADFEPRLALDGGPDGLEVVRRLARDAGDFLKDTGYLIVEIGDDQEVLVRDILTSSARFEEIQSFKDLLGRPRVIKARIVR